MTDRDGIQKIDLNFLLNKFQITAGLLRKELPPKSEIKIITGVYARSIYMKMYKNAWANDYNELQMPASWIFFSVWINENAIMGRKLFYNIHAFKLRQLRGYSISSRKFADNFRTMFKEFEHKFPNVSIEFGPQTLMQGWKQIDMGMLENEILRLSFQFLEIEELIDKNLQNFKRK
jgi:hypothetical protein